MAEGIVEEIHCSQEAEKERQRQEKAREKEIGPKVYPSKLDPQ